MAKVIDSNLVDAQLVNALVQARMISARFGHLPAGADFYDLVAQIDGLSRSQKVNVAADKSQLAQEVKRPLA